MNDPRRLRRQRALGDRPSAGLFRADGEIGLQAQQRIARADQTVQARLGQPHFLKEHRGLILGQLADLFLDPSRNHHTRRPLGAGHLGHAVRLAVAGGRLGLLDVADVKHGLRGQQLQHAPLLLVVGRNRHRARRLARVQGSQSGAQKPVLIQRILIAAPQLFAQRRQPPLNALHIGQHEFGLNRLGIGDRINPALDMGDVAIFKTAQHMGNGITFADIGEKLVAQALTL